MGTEKREEGSEGRWSEGRRELVVRNTSRGNMKWKEVREPRGSDPGKSSGLETGCKKHALSTGLPGNREQNNGSGVW